MKSTKIRSQRRILRATTAIWATAFLACGVLNAQDADKTAETPAAQAITNGTDAPTAEAAEPGQEPVAQGEKRLGRRHHRLDHDVLFMLGHDVELKQGESAETVVVIGGSAKIHGKVKDTVVSIFGNLDIDGEVGDTAVAIMGNITAGQGAKIHGEVVTVGGKVDVAEGATLDQHPEVVDFPNWTKSWFTHCVLMVRPLAPQVGWVWGVAGVFFLIYLLTAALFPRPVQACVTELVERPATTFLLGILTNFLLPLVLLILAATGLGLIVVPFVLAALLFGALIGKVAIVEGLGMRLGRLFGAEMTQKPLIALVMGAVFIALLYMVPLLGLLTFGVISLWGLGAAVTAAFGGMRREMPAKLAASTPEAQTPAMAGVAVGLAGTAYPGPGAPDPGTPAPATTVPGVPPVMLPEALDFPKAGFWERMAASFLDVVLVSILGAVVGAPPLAFLVALAYFTGMWAWKGTTIGGIVLGLKVARLDGHPVTFAVALVRALAGAFSLVVLFLGILWIAWDKDKQGWHDKIAGTTVLKLPRGTPLLLY